MTVFVRRRRRIAPTPKAVQLHAYVTEWHDLHGTGVDPSVAARVLGVRREAVEQILITCETSGLLMYEDDNGNIYPLDYE